MNTCADWHGGQCRYLPIPGGSPTAEADVADKASGFFGEGAEAGLSVGAFVAAVLGGARTSNAVRRSTRFRDCS